MSLVGPRHPIRKMVDHARNFVHPCGVEFEWDPAKSALNKEKHDIDFSAAQALWDDPGLILLPSKYPDEPRFLALGRIEHTHWTAIFTERGDRIRIEFLAGCSDDGDRITVCLADAAGGCPKAFDIRPDARPRFVTSGATPVCTQVAAEVQSLFLWEMRTAGPVNVVNATIALDAHRGRNMRITWLETGNPAGCTAH